jgi:GT2 family glycosyltransferase
LKISIVVPHYYSLNYVDNALKRCVKSMHGQGEIIILANDGMGYGAACNLGMRLAHGDFIILANNDTWLIEGSLEDLLDNDFITVPVIEPAAKDNLPRAFFCVPRALYETVYEACGDFFDERFEGGYWEDDDLHRRLEALGIRTRLVESVVVGHLNGGGLTMKQIGEQEYFDKNKKVYEDIWLNP